MCILLLEEMEEIDDTSLRWRVARGEKKLRNGRLRAKEAENGAGNPP
jgi:hypothetical protein